MVKKTLCIFLSVGMLFFCARAFAEVFISPQEAIKEMFPDYKEHKLETHTIDEQKIDIFRVFSDSKLIGWAAALNEKGMKEPITFLAGIDLEGRVKDVYVLEYREPHGFEIKEKSFTGQFQGKTVESPIEVGGDIDAVTKATISSKSAALAVKKALIVINDLRKDA